MLLTDDAMDCAIFVAETEKSAVVHTACSKTAAGKQRLNDYMKILSDTLLNEMEIFDSHTPSLVMAVKFMLKEEPEQDCRKQYDR